MFRKKYEDQIRGCLVGGAIGDALGLPIEFLKEDEIFEKYGSEGITEYDLTDGNGKALISDDTQMTLFTAVGMLVWETRSVIRGFAAAPRNYIEEAYLDWLDTQDYSEVGYRERFAEDRISWIMTVPELYNWRAPGGTCMKSLRHLRKGMMHPDDFYATAWNDKKGCGGVMRIAPVALVDELHSREAALEAAQVAAITHGHPLGYMPASVVAYIIHESVYGDPGKSLKEIVLESRDVLRVLFPDSGELIGIIDDAVACSENDRPDLENIHRLGAGWVAEETMAIALYCSLKYEQDFSKALITAVNHNGDSDSTGAVTGNILGARLGYEAIPEKWKKDLELQDVVLEIADDMASGCPYEMTEDNERWFLKYLR